MPGRGSEDREYQPDTNSLLAEEEEEDEKPFDQLISGDDDDDDDDDFEGDQFFKERAVEEGEEEEDEEDEGTLISKRRSIPSKKRLQNDEKVGGGGSVGGVAGKDPYFDVALPTLFEANIEFRTLFDYMEREIIDLSPIFQREVVWKETDQKKLLNSIESNICIPPLIFNLKVKDGTNILREEGMSEEGENELEEGSYICCDGKQRITSIQKFMRNEISITDDNKHNWFYNRSAPDTATIKSFTPARREAFDNRTIGIAYYHNLNRDQESLLFSRIQEGKALTYDEKLRATSGGQLASFVETVVDKYYIEEDIGFCENSRLIPLLRAKEFTSALRTILNILEPPSHWSQANLLKTVIEHPFPTPFEEKKVFSIMDRFLRLTLLTSSGEIDYKNTHKVWKTPKALAPVELPWLPLICYKYRDFSDGDVLEIIGIFRKGLSDQFPGNVSINSTVEGWIKRFLDKTISADSLTHKYVIDTSTSSKKKSQSQSSHISSVTSSSTNYYPNRRTTSNSNTQSSVPPLPSTMTTNSTSTSIKRSYSSQNPNFSPPQNKKSKLSSSQSQSLSRSQGIARSKSIAAPPIMSSDSEDSNSESGLPLRSLAQRNSPRSLTSSDTRLPPFSSSSSVPIRMGAINKVGSSLVGLGVGVGGSRLFNTTTHSSTTGRNSNSNSNSNFNSISNSNSVNNLNSNSPRINSSTFTTDPSSSSSTTTTMARTKSSNPALRQAMSRLPSFKNSIPIPTTTSTNEIIPSPPLFPPLLTSPLPTTSSSTITHTYSRLPPSTLNFHQTLTLAPQAPSPSLLINKVTGSNSKSLFRARTPSGGPFIFDADGVDKKPILSNTTSNFPSPPPPVSNQNTVNVLNDIGIYKSKSLPSSPKLNSNSAKSRLPPNPYVAPSTTNSTSTSTSSWGGLVPAVITAVTEAEAATSTTTTMDQTSLISGRPMGIGIGNGNGNGNENGLITCPLPPPPPPPAAPLDTSLEKDSSPKTTTTASSSAAELLMSQALI